MISAAELRTLVEEKIAGTDNYLVDLTIGNGNQIHIELENDVAVSIEDCMKVSRFVEHEVLDREVEDFSLEVTSPGVTRPFKVRRQYGKNVGRDVKVVRNDGTSIKGRLTEVDEEGIKLTTRQKERVEGHKKKKEWVETVHPISFDEIKETKVVLAF